MASELLGKRVRRKTKTKQKGTAILYSFTPAKKELFLAGLRKHAMVNAAATDAGVTVPTVYNHRRSDPEFAANWEASLEEGVGVAERELHRRAVEGVAEGVWHKGRLVGTERKYSDRLLEFLLRSHAPAKYRERFDVNVSASVTHKHQLDLSTLKDCDLKSLEKLMGKARVIDSTAERVA